MDTKRNLTCPTCYKDYKRKSFYNRHIIVCEMLKDKSYDDEEIQDLPSTYELYTMVKEIAIKYNECKNECTHLKTRLNLLEKKYKKVEILPEEYLLQNKQCDNSYDEWLKTISIKKEHVHNLDWDQFSSKIGDLLDLAADALKVSDIRLLSPDLPQSDDRASVSSKSTKGKQRQKAPTDRLPI